MSSQQELACKPCGYVTTRRQDFTKHLLTKKHVRTVNPPKRCKKKQKCEFKCECGKSYKHLSGLSRHRAVCDIYLSIKLMMHLDIIDEQKTEAYEDIQATTDKCETQKTSMSSVSGSRKSYVENVIVDKPADLAKTDDTEQPSNSVQDQPTVQAMLSDIARQLKEIKELNATQVIAPTTNYNNHNYIVNVNMFLNENCKDALSLQDFFKQIKFVFDDLKDKTWRSRILLNNLDSLQLENRPFHCVDATTCQVVMKNGTEWQEGNKEDIVSTLDSCGRHVQQQFGPQWDKEYPGWVESDKQSKRYMHLWRNISTEPTPNVLQEELRRVSTETQLLTDRQMLLMNDKT